MKNKREGISKRIRFDVFKRDNFLCQYCGRTPPSVILEIDHIIPISKGGTHTDLNFITACFDCNRGKSNVSLGNVLEPLKAQIEKDKEKTEQIKEFNRYLLKKRKDQENSIKEIGLYWHNQFKEEKDVFIFGSARVPSIKTFLRFLTKPHLLEAIDIAFSRHFPKYNNDQKTFKYFCGICWKMIKREG